jgi:hypothetical protein
MHATAAVLSMISRQATSPGTRCRTVEKAIDLVDDLQMAATPFDQADGPGLDFGISV